MQSPVKEQRVYVASLKLQCFNSSTKNSIQHAVIPLSIYTTIQVATSTKTTLNHSRNNHINNIIVTRGCSKSSSYIPKSKIQGNLKNSNNLLLTAHLLDISQVQTTYFTTITYIDIYPQNILHSQQNSIMSNRYKLHGCHHFL